MGSGISGLKGYPLCCGTSHYEINNNLYGNYGEMKLDKDKKIITNIFIPNCELKISPDTLNKDQINNLNNNTPLQIKLNKYKNHRAETECKYENKNSREINNTLNKYFNSKIKESTSAEGTTGGSKISKQIKNISITEYNDHFIDYLNKLRTCPNLVIEDIDTLIKTKIQKIDNNDYLISEDTNEIIKMQDNCICLDNIKEFLAGVEPIGELQLNKELKIKYVGHNLDINEKKIKEIIIEKKKEIIDEFPSCFFYPIFIKDIKINIISLIANNTLREKLFDNNLSYFYATIFNIKNNRFFTILCFS